jgi:pimeloyl-ACP methyl ester carboxylesterase
MSNEQDTPAVRHVDTPSGRIGYVEVGSGPVALFVHGVLLNKHMWRYQLGALSDFRRCIAVDLLAHGDTEIAAAQDVSVTANAKMLKEVLDALHIDQVDLIGNDSGGGICQIFAALNPDRVRTLTLTNCDIRHDFANPQTIILKDIVAAALLSLMVPGDGAPSHNGLFVSPCGMRQDPPWPARAFEALVVDEPVNAL